MEIHRVANDIREKLADQLSAQVPSCEMGLTTSAWGDVSLGFLFQWFFLGFGKGVSVFSTDFNPWNLFKTIQNPPKPSKKTSKNTKKHKKTPKNTKKPQKTPKNTNPNRTAPRLSRGLGHFGRLEIQRQHGEQSRSEEQRAVAWQCSLLGLEFLFF